MATHTSLAAVECHEGRHSVAFGPDTEHLVEAAGEVALDRRGTERGTVSLMSREALEADSFPTSGVERMTELSKLLAGAAGDAP